MPPVDPHRPAAGAGGADPAPGQAVYLLALTEAAAAFAAWPQSELFPPPFLHRVGAIAGLVSLVPSEEYGGPSAVARLADPAWLSPRILHHAEVLRQAMQRAPIYPAPFGTLYSSLPRLTVFMLAHQETIRQFLEAVAGQQEWGLRATMPLASPAALAARARDSWPDWERLPPGTRYLRLCQERPSLIAAGRAAAEQTIAALVEELRPPASSLCRLARQRPADSDGSELVLRFALLVPVAATALLARGIDELGAAAAAREITLSLSGPWPPFSFRPALTDPTGEADA